MKNILGTTENLNLYNKEGKRVYEFYKNSQGYSYERTYDSNDYLLTFKDSNGYSSEYTYDSNGKELTFKDSNGDTRGFDIPEYTMEQLVEKLGNFKTNKIMKQTAVEWLIEKIKNFDYVADTLIKQAKEMEKQQIIDACNIDKRSYDNAEQYYNETFTQNKL